jgi:hypothetical protein
MTREQHWLRIDNGPPILLHDQHVHRESWRAVVLWRVIRCVVEIVGRVAR